MILSSCECGCLFNGSHRIFFSNVLWFSRPSLSSFSKFILYLILPHCFLSVCMHTEMHMCAEGQRVYYKNTGCFYCSPLYFLIFKNFTLTMSDMYIMYFNHISPQLSPDLYNKSPSHFNASSFITHWVPLVLLVCK